MSSIYQWETLLPVFNWTALFNQIIAIWISIKPLQFSSFLSTLMNIIVIVFSFCLEWNNHCIEEYAKDLSESKYFKNKL